jgi:hypothetical protein
MFVDEEQYMEPNTLKLVTGLVEQSDPSDPKKSSGDFFYDNSSPTRRVSPASEKIRTPRPTIFRGAHDIS